MKRDRNAMIHWWYTPDSYDVWVPDVSPDLEIDTPQHSGALEVSVAGEYWTVCCVISPPNGVLAWLTSAVLGDTCPMILSVLIIAKMVYRNKNLKIQTYFNLPFMHSFQNFISSFMIKKKNYIWLECQDCNVPRYEEIFLINSL